MKKSFLPTFTIILLLTVPSFLKAQTPKFSWVKGAQSLNQPAEFGGAPSSRNMPNFWIDKNGDLWLFGGQGFDKNGDSGESNDLWRYDLETSVWTWMGGGETVNQPGVYGTKGVPSTDNIPGARSGWCSWTDGAGNLWLFGGGGYASTGEGGSMNDLWKYVPDDRTWTWVGGSDQVNSPGSFGNKGEASPANFPSNRHSSKTWVDGYGNLWLFGGMGTAKDGSLGALNDLWKYEISVDKWTWMGGGETAFKFGGDGNEGGNYGTKGVPSSSNWPGARFESMSWTDSNGNFWMFGGEGFDINGKQGLLNDLWNFDVASATWVWRSGSASAEINGHYGPNGVYGEKGIPSATNYPGGRATGFSWIDSNGKLWLFGGYGFDDSKDYTEYLNDLWQFDPIENTWTWIGGAKTNNQDGDNDGWIDNERFWSTKGIPSSKANPGGMMGYVSWVDETNSFWLLSETSIWNFNPNEKLWAWVDGYPEYSMTRSEYQQLGITPELTPGSRQNPIFWSGSNGEVYIYGGRGLDERGNEGLLLDFWTLNTDKGNWNYLTPRLIGSQAKEINLGSEFTTLYSINKNDYPGSRELGASWIDGKGDLWLFGGTGYSKRSGGFLNDLWKFSFENGSWIWMGGGDSANEPGNYGSLNQSSRSNFPGAREGATSWKDLNGNLWLFGGWGYGRDNQYGYLNDLWRYSLADSAWTWVSGSDEIDQKGIYGVRGISGVGYPGGRAYSAKWTDALGNFWMYGGSGYDKNGIFAMLGDLWKFDVSKREWTWVAGDDVVQKFPVHGELGMQNPQNTPGSRRLSNSWIDHSGNLWLFAGQGSDPVDGSVNYNDLWKYDTSTGNWAWMGGSDRSNQPGQYLTLGDPSGVPGARQSAISWSDTRGNFWLFGGSGFDGNGSGGYLNDVWKISTDNELSVQAKLITPITCNGGKSQVEVSAEGGTPPYAGVGTFEVAAGNYSFTVTDASGNSGSASIMVEEPEALQASFKTNKNYLLYGLSGEQKANITVIPEGPDAEGPFRVSISMNRPLLCNQFVSSGDESLVASAGGMIVNGSCPNSGAVSMPAIVTWEGISAGTILTLEVILMKDAAFTLVVEGTTGCSYTTSLLTGGGPNGGIDAEDVRCFTKSMVQKIQVCHMTSSGKNPCVGICIDESSLEEHLRHGDFLGKCTSSCSSPVPNARDISSEDLKLGPFEVLAYPNPFSDEITILVGSQLRDRPTIDVLGLNGDLINIPISVGRGEGELILHGSGLSAGFYILKLTVRDFTVYRKLVKR